MSEFKENSAAVSVISFITSSKNCVSDISHSSTANIPKHLPRKMKVALIHEHVIKNKGFSFLLLKRLAIFQGHKLGTKFEVQVCRVLVNNRAPVWIPKFVKNINLEF